MNSKALREAFKATESGKRILIEAKKRESHKIGDRIRELKNLCYASFVADLPPREKRWDVYQANKKGIRKLGVRGGYAYENAMTCLKFAGTGRKCFNDAIRVLKEASL